MSIISGITTANFEDTVLAKSNAQSFTVQVANQSVLYQLNVPPYGQGENWMPINGAELRPGYWNFASHDWVEYGVQHAQGIRFKAVSISDPGVVSVT